MLFINWHLGLGDALLQNGLVRHLAEKEDWVYVPSEAGKFYSVQQMFSDLYNVIVLEVKADNNLLIERPSYCPVLDLGYNNPAYRPLLDRMSFAEGFYAQLDIPYDESYTKFHIPEVPNPLPPVDKIVHEDTPRGYLISESYKQGSSVGYPSFNDKVIAAWVPAIRRAHEIHCIDSSFMHLVDRTETKAKLFFHRYARPHPNPFDHAPLRKDWTILDKP